MIDDEAEEMDAEGQEEDEIAAQQHEEFPRDIDNGDDSDSDFELPRRKAPKKNWKSAA